MSNIIKRLAKKQKRGTFLKRRKEYRRPPKRYTSFNIFTQYGENIVVESDRPMTLEEAQFHYKALSISGNE